MGTLQEYRALPITLPGNTLCSRGHEVMLYKNHIWQLVQQSNMQQIVKSPSESGFPWTSIVQLISKVNPI